jgi:hypothetical protein
MINAYKNLVGKPERKGLRGRISGGGRIILKLILNEQDVKNVDRTYAGKLRPYGHLL